MQLAEQTRHDVVVTTGVRDPSGRPISGGVRIPFTTMSGTTELDRLRKALDDGSAYSQVGATKQVSFDSAGVTTVFPATDAELITRMDQVKADPAEPLASSFVPNLAVAGVRCYAFGSYESPQFVDRDATIPPVPSTTTPPALSKARTGVALIVPAGTPPAGGWPVAVYGPGFTRSYFDLFVTSDLNAAAGIATIATNPLGHGHGPASSIGVGPSGSQTVFPSYGRGADLDGDGEIGDAEGSQPTEFRGEPSPKVLNGLRGALTQTVVDNMALVRAVENGITVPSCGGGSVPLRPTGVEYYGLSFGGIYGTMLMGTDPHVQVGLLNVAGGPIIEIARTSGFRDLLARTLEISRPSLLNGGPGLNGFTESIPQETEPPVTDPYPGAFRLQEFLADATWFGRPGGPETHAPTIRKNPRNGVKTVLFQVAYGDGTVPNPTAGNLIRAGALQDRVTYYRNDKTATAGTNPHGFPADPRLQGRQMAELQLTTFLRTRGQTVIDPDGPGPIFEVAIANEDNLRCLHYPAPQTGQGAYPPAPSGECPPPYVAKTTSGPPPGATASPSSSAGSSPGAGSGGGAGQATSASAARGSSGLPATGLTTLIPLTALALLLAAGVARRTLRRR